MELTVAYEHDYNSMLRFVKLHYKVRQRIIRKLYAVLLPFLAISALGLSVLCTVHKSWTSSDILTVIVSTIVFILILFRPQIYAFMSIRRRVKKVGIMQIAFSDDAVQVTTGIGKEEYLYSSICDLFFCDNTLYAYIDKLHALIFPGTAVQNGSIEELCSFLSGKTGLEIKTVK